MKNYEELLKEQTLLESERLILRPFTMNDVDDVFLFASDDEATKYLTWVTHTKRSQSEAVVKELYMQHSGTFAIELKSEGKCIGCIDLRVDKDHDKGSFGYVMTRNYWGHGYMSEALSLLLDVAFTTLNINRVEARHYSKNIASGRVMEKCGMQYEGTALQEVKVKGVYFDVVHYGILKQNYSSPYKKEKC